MDRFLCDEMVVRLGKWLRAAGYDTVIAIPGSDDGALLAAAMNENRMLLTRDRKFLERRGALGVVLLLNGNDIDSWVAQITRELHIDWLHRPFSRCLICNGELQPGLVGDEGKRVPGYVISEHIPCFHCRACNKPYWEGGHVTRMRRRLSRYQSLGGVGDDDAAGRSA